MRVDFQPKTHGFAFPNNFTNKVSILGIPITETQGRCGGMAFAALDYWHNRLAIPSSQTLPADPSPVADYIYWRLIDSIRDNWPMYFHFMRTPDHPTVINGIGVARATREEQLPNLIALLDAGTPQPLGLVRSTDITQFGNDHQVVAYGYEVQGDNTCVFVWDNNHPGIESTLTFRSMYDPNDRAIHGSDGTDWRGFFVSSYSPQLPNYLQKRRLLKEQSDPRIYVVYGGGKSWIPDAVEFEASGYRWNEVTTYPDDALRHVADVPGDRTVIRALDDPKVYVTYGHAKFWITDPDALAALGFSWSDVVVAPTGALAQVGDVPADGTVLTQLGRPEVYVIEGGKKRWISDPVTFRQLGHSWDRMGQVASGQLDHLPDGAPYPSLQPLTWAQQADGHFITRDHDQLDYRIDPGVLPAADEVEFVLEQPANQTWRKELVLHADDGTWTIAVQDQIHSDRNGLYRAQLPNGHLVFRKAKTFGIMTDVFELAQLDTLPAGSRVTFSWARDSPQVGFGVTIGRHAEAPPRPLEVEMACIDIRDRFRAALRTTGRSGQSIALCGIGLSAIGLGFLSKGTARDALTMVGVLIVVFGVVYPAASEVSLTPTNLSIKKAAAERTLQVADIYRRYGAKLERVAEGLAGGGRGVGFVQEALGELMDYAHNCERDEVYLHAICEVVRAADSERRLALLSSSSSETPDDELGCIDFPLRCALVLHEVAGTDHVGCARALHLTLGEFEQRLQDAFDQRATRFVRAEA